MGAIDVTHHSDTHHQKNGAADKAGAAAAPYSP